jgi:Polyketide cyclase / dehydrase and lipid transport
MLRGDATSLVKGVTPQEVFDFVIDPAQYRLADTKIVRVTKLGDRPNGMVAREDGKFMGRLPGSVINGYEWHPPRRIDIRHEFGFPKSFHAWFDIEEADGGTTVRHVEEIEIGKGPLGWLIEAIARRWWMRSVDQEVVEIARLMESGRRGRGLAAAGTMGPIPEEGASKSA